MRWTASDGYFLKDRELHYENGVGAVVIATGPVSRKQTLRLLRLEHWFWRARRGLVPSTVEEAGWAEGRVRPWY